MGDNQKDNDKTLWHLFMWITSQQMFQTYYNFMLMLTGCSLPPYTVPFYNAVVVTV